MYLSRSRLNPSEFNAAFLTSSGVGACVNVFLCVFVFIMIILLF